MQRWGRGVFEISNEKLQGERTRQISRSFNPIGRHMNVDDRLSRIWIGLEDVLHHIPLINELTSIRFTKDSMTIARIHRTVFLRNRFPERRITGDEVGHIATGKIKAQLSEQISIRWFSCFMIDNSLAGVCHDYRMVQQLVHR